MQLHLEDLRPEEAKLTLSDKPGKTYTLKKITLATRIWLKQRFKDEAMKDIFENQKLPEISEIAYHLLKEKEDFPTLESFQEALVTMQDFVNLVQAILTTIGISEPVIKKISETEQGNSQSLSQPTGAQSST